jgi:tetratricopeptide (TPR) repeat protein
MLCSSMLGAVHRTPYGGTAPVQNASSSAALRSMARVYMACGQYAKAQPLLERALNLAQTTNAPDAELCACLIDSAYLYKEQGNLSQAERLCRLGLELQEKVYRPNHPYVAYTLRILGEIYRKQSRYQQAKNVLDRAIAIMRAVRSDDGQEIAPFKVDMARLLMAAGELPEAEAYFKEALPVISRSFGPQHLYTAKVQSSLAALYASEGRYTEADALISKALAVYEKVHGPDHPFLVPLWLTKARIDQAQGETANAKMLLEKSLRVVRNHDDSGPLIEAKVLSRLGEFYLLTKKYAKAKDVLHEALKILERSQDAGSDRTAVALNTLARVYVETGKYSEAGNLCGRALDILEPAVGRDHPHVADVMETLAHLHRKTGNMADVAKLERRVEQIRVRQQVAYVPVANAVQ